MLPVNNEPQRIGASRIFSSIFALYMDSQTILVCGYTSLDIIIIRNCRVFGYGRLSGGTVANANYFKVHRSAITAQQCPLVRCMITYTHTGIETCRVEINKNKLPNNSCSQVFTMRVFISVYFETFRSSPSHFYFISLTSAV